MSEQKQITDENFHEETFEPIEEPSEVKDVEVKSEEPSQEVEEVVEKVQEPEVPEGVDNEKSYKHFQRLAEQRKTEIEKEKQAREALEARLREIEENKPQQPQREEIQPPVKPQKPHDYDVADIYDKNSSTYKYEVALQQYREDKEAYQDAQLQKVSTSIEEQRKKEELAQYTQAHRQHWMGEFLKIPGATPEDAGKAYDKFMKGGTATPENIYKLYLIDEGKYNPKPEVKKKDKLNTVLPPGVESGGENESLKSPDDQFNESIKNTSTGSWI